MELETRFLRLRQPLKLGDQIDGWRVCWLGGWVKNHLFYVVMVVRDRIAPAPATVTFRWGLEEDRRWPVPIKVNPVPEQS
jgi:hypothetical protein